MSKLVPQVMRAIRVTQFGRPEVMKLEVNYPVPQVKENEVLVRVHASGINPVDTYIRAGTYTKLPPLPYTPGKDGAGVVAGLGAGVAGFTVGQRVFFSKNCREGSLAEYVAVPHTGVFPLHEKLSFSEGASLAIPYFTAHRALFLKGLGAPGKRVLVHGGSGAVGQAVLQLARAGAARVYCHREADYMAAMKAGEPEGFDIIIEMLANANVNADLSVLRPRGCVVVVGCRGDAPVFSPRLMMAPETSIVGCAFASATPEEKQQSASAVLAAIEEGCVQPRVSKTYSMEQAAQGHTDVIEGGSTLGKLVVLCAPE